MVAAHHSLAPHRSPSAWPDRLPVVALALTGLGIAVYLTLYQVHVLAHVWEPFFGNGGSRILRESPLVRLIHPVPDAALGTAGYFVEAVLELLGGEDRWHRRPWLVATLGVVAAGMAVFGLVFVILQAAFAHFCTLCLASAVCSVLAAALAAKEVTPAVRLLLGR